jgi:RNA polymerase sigma factor (sigma-70 family)
MQLSDTSTPLDAESSCFPLLMAQDEIDVFLGAWRERLRRTARNLLGASLAARADTSDVAQESVLQTWQDLKKFRGASTRQFAAWSRRIGRGHAAKIRRHHLAERRSVELDVADQPSPVDVGNDPSMLAERQETLLLLAESLERLPELERAVVLMRIFENQTFGEIATCIGKCESSARALFGSATKRLHTMLKQYGLHELP